MNLIEFDNYGRKKIILGENNKELSWFGIVLMVLWIISYCLFLNNIFKVFFSWQLIVFVCLSVILGCKGFNLLNKERKQLQIAVPDYYPKMFLFIDWMDYKLIDKFNQEIIRTPLINLSIEDLHYNMLIVEGTKPTKPMLNFNLTIIIISLIGLIISNYSPVFQFINMGGVKEVTQEDTINILKNIFQILTIIGLVFVFIIMSSFYFSYVFYNSEKSKYEQYIKKRELINFLIYYKNNFEIHLNREEQDE